MATLARCLLLSFFVGLEANELTDLSLTKAENATRAYLEKLELDAAKEQEVLHKFQHLQKELFAAGGPIPALLGREATPGKIRGATVGVTESPEAVPQASPQDRLSAMIAEFKEGFSAEEKQTYEELIAVHGDPERFARELLHGDPERFARELGKTGKEEANEPAKSSPRSAEEKEEPQLDTDAEDAMAGGSGLDALGGDAGLEDELRGMFDDKAFENMYKLGPDGKKELDFEALMKELQKSMGDLGLGDLGADPDGDGDSDL